ncbi:hypothetical protein EV356DRAFT_475929, partial [Viridothelium virens]
MSNFLPSSWLYPNTTEAAVKQQFIGCHLKDINPPAAVIDAAVVRRNCGTMLEAVKHLDIGFRAHVKTHKTTQITQLQVGDTKQVNLVVSTVAEAEQLLPFLLESKGRGKSVSMLYGMPPPPSSLQRLGALAKQLGPESLSVLLDHPDTIDHLRQVSSSVWSKPIHSFIKVDTGYHRAGAEPQSSRMKAIIEKLESNKDHFLLQGFYSHMGHSYGFSSPAEALDGLVAEITGAAEAAAMAGGKDVASKRLIITVGATPTATAAQNILAGGTDARAQMVKRVIQQMKEDYEIELHAGVYPILDLQQLATRARPSTQEEVSTYLSTASLGLRILVEVSSVYDDREKPQALIAAGTLALGREPCKSYPGWGVVTSWQDNSSSPASGPVYGEEDRTGWIVGKISQEHGILTWEGQEQSMRRLKIGDKLMLWPNHACVAGSGFGWYLIVDSESEDPDVVQDVWVRWRGW